jgi:hypothetical protein
VLHLAAEEAQSLGHKHVGTEHLFLGLLRVESGLAAKILGKHNVRADEVRSAMVKISAHVQGERRASAHIRPYETLEPFLEAFLKQLCSGLSGDVEQFFLPGARYIDSHGKHWPGLESLANLSQLFAPFAAPDARIVEKELLQPVGNLCIATFLWEDISFPRDDRKAPARMAITVTIGERSAWRICAIQVTPVKA